MRPLDHVREQLWGPALDSPDLRVVVDTPQDAEWADAERYWLVPDEAHARLLVPAGPSPMSARSLTNYRNLRTPRVNGVRFALGALARRGLPVGRSSVSVQVRRSAPEAARRLPLSMLAAALGRPLFAATGVRTSDNRKTTLHLLDPTGQPVGYAKIGWNASTDGFVANEARALRRVGGREGPTRAPRVLTEVDYLGHPVVVTEPLPLDARGSLSRVAPPSAEEMFALTPVVRHDVPGGTGQLKAMVDRLEASAGHAASRPIATAALQLASSVASTADRVPVTSLWHGDMTPWNRARDRSGQLWVWDWESSEDDAVAGLDPLQWAFGSRRLATGDARRVRLVDCLQDADGYLTAAGVARRDRPTVAATYALTVVERACGLAAQSGTWDDALIGPEGLVDLLDEATALLRRAG